MGRWWIRSALRLASAVGLLGCVAAASADTIIPGGTVINQTWTAAGSPYIVQGDVIVPQNAYLTIEAGTVVEFASTDAQVSGVDPNRIELTVNGALTVNGTATQPVTFEAQTGTAPGTWYGIVIGTSATSALIHNTSIQHPRIAIHDEAGVLQLSNSTISLCSDIGVELDTGSPNITFVTVSCNSSYGILAGLAPTQALILDSVTVTGAQRNSSAFGISIGGAGAVTITNAVVYGNANGIQVASGGSVSLANATVDRNTALGIYAYIFGTGSAFIRNSSITSNGSTSSNPSGGLFVPIESCLSKVLGET